MPLGNRKPTDKPVLCPKCGKELAYRARSGDLRSFAPDLVYGKDWTATAPNENGIEIDICCPVCGELVTIPA